MVLHDDPSTPDDAVIDLADVPVIPDDVDPDSSYSGEARRWRSSDLRRGYSEPRRPSSDLRC